MATQDDKQMQDQHKNDTDIKKQLDKIVSIELQHFQKKFKIEGIDPECITNDIIFQSISNDKD